jgi:DNA-binding MarR family transcriptional regulator
MISRLPDISRLLERMQGANLIRKKPAKEDRRVVRVIIAARGLRILERLEAPLLQLHLRQFAALEREELARLNLLLERTRFREPGQTNESD